MAVQGEAHSHQQALRVWAQMRLYARSHRWEVSERWHSALGVHESVGTCRLRGARGVSADEATVHSLHSSERDGHIHTDQEELQQRRADSGVHSELVRKPRGGGWLQHRFLHPISGGWRDLDGRFWKGGFILARKAAHGSGHHHQAMEHRSVAHVARHAFAEIQRPTGDSLPFGIS